MKNILAILSIPTFFFIKGYPAVRLPVLTSRSAITDTSRPSCCPVEQDGLEVSVIALREVRTGRRTAG
jgi:hypothetical protein